MLRRDFQVKQLQFYSSLKIIIGIIPSFDSGEIYLMTGPVGPFKSQHEMSVPLWLAMTLKAKNKCRIIPPSWLNVEQLSLIYQNQEKFNQPVKVHQYFFQINYTILNDAWEDLDQSKKLRTLVEGIETLREQKLKKLLQTHSTDIRVVNYTTFQLNKFQSVLSMIHSNSYKIDTSQK